MRPITQKGFNVVYAKDQEQYNQLPAHKAEGTDGVVTSCWKISFWEKLRIVFTGKLFISVMTFNNPPQPIYPSTKFKIPK